MNTAFLLLSTCAIAFLGYFLTGRSIASPSVLFIVPFVFAIIDGLFYYKEWLFNIHIETMSIVLICMVVFVLSSCVVHGFSNFFTRRKVINIESNFIKNEAAERKLYISMIVFQFVSLIICFVAERNIVSSYGYGGSISDVIGGYNDLLKFSDSDVALTGIPALLQGLMIGVSYISAYFFARDFLYRKDRNKNLAVAFFVVSILCLVVNGSRTGAFGLCLAAFVMYLIRKKKDNSFSGLLNLNIKYIIYPLAGILLVVVLFYLSLAWLGRDKESDFLYYISVYLGAPLRNFDLTFYDGIPRSQYFGQFSFKYLYLTIVRFGLAPQDALVGAYPFNSFHGYWLGNVYTIFYSLIADFGTAGCILAVVLMAIISQILYEITVRTINDSLLISVVYGYLSFHLFMSFFSCNFYQNLTSMSFVKFLIPVILISYLYRSSFKRI
ncbi:polysaccharide polymerase [Bifidobacterium goeldii]|uniref:Polysaccharide polymerase n=1 Tax=Bifidobacterium goeldii TaxID=2306975 RepID=A0A430FG65_9BIFI|nr:O-antigen polymerase [Bifidobacterium goeldii]RSX51762.1 polysaccharide polymerase [Bifidobacterium goeldii]